MGNYDGELKRHCMMLAVKQRREEEEELRRSLASTFDREKEDTGDPGDGLLMLLAIGGVLWVIDKIDRGLKEFMSIPWVRGYMVPFLTVGNLVCISVAWLLIRRVRGGEDGRIKGHC